MRFLILFNDVLPFTRWLYARHAGLEQQTFEEQRRIRYESLYFRADFYSSNLRQLGHDAWDLYPDNAAMQEAWAREHGLAPAEQCIEGTVAEQAARPAWQRLQYRSPVYHDGEWCVEAQPPRRLYEILAAQIEHYKPDVLINQDLYLNATFFRHMKPRLRLLIGQHWSRPLPEASDFSAYDLILSSFTPTLTYFQQRGIPAELHRLGFEPRILDEFPPGERPLDTSFVGNVFDAGIHRGRVEFLEELCARYPQLKIWGFAVRTLSPDSAIRRSYVGHAWGRGMYQVLRRSKITINHHGYLPPYANNMRLFEATGMGALLITDWKVNLHKMFEPGVEVVTYRTTAECADLMRYYLAHADEREAIASAGQQRTLRDHTYGQRMQELVEIVGRYL